MCVKKCFVVQSKAMMGRQHLLTCTSTSVFNVCDTVIVFSSHLNYNFFFMSLMTFFVVCRCPGDDVKWEPSHDIPSSYLIPGTIINCDFASSFFLRLDLCWWCCATYSCENFFFHIHFLLSLVMMQPACCYYYLVAC